MQITLSQNHMINILTSFTHLYSKCNNMKNKSINMFHYYEEF